MSKSIILQKILTYIAGNRLKAALKAQVKYMVVEANEIEMHLEGPNANFEPEPPDKLPVDVAIQRLNAIYDDEPLGFEKDPITSNIKMLTHDPLEEIDLGDRRIKVQHTLVPTLANNSKLR